MKRIHNTTILVTSALMVSVPSGVRWLSIHESRRHEVTHPGCCTAASVAGLAERLRQRLMPETAFDSIDVTSQQVYDAAERPRREWAAQCSRGSGRIGVVGPSMYLKWDAGTGRLIYVSRNRTPTSGTFGHIAVRQAMRASRFWLKELGMVCMDGSWRLSNTPVHNGCAWVLKFRSGQRAAMVTIYLCDGTLQSAHTWTYLP